MSSHGQKSRQRSQLPRNPKGYDFVCIPFTKTVTPVSHVRKIGASGLAFSGRMDIEIKTLSPLHISDGTLRLSEELGFMKGFTVRSILCPEDPIIPGTTLKGAARTYYEAITKSCVSQFLRRMKAKYAENERGASTLPQELVRQIVAAGGEQRGVAEVAILPECFERIERCSPVRKRSSRLCPACLLFGTNGFAGRVTFSDARLISSPHKGGFLYVVPRGAPRLHRIGSASVAPGTRNTKLVVEKLKGRKVYNAKYEPNTPSQEAELWDYVPAGALFSGQILFHDVSMAEMGGLFGCLGIDRKMAVTIGGGKSSGLGKISISSKEILAFPSGLMQRTSFEQRKPIDDRLGFIKQCKAAFIKSPFAYPKSYEVLKRICAV